MRPGPIVSVFVPPEDDAVISKAYGVVAGYTARPRMSSVPACMRRESSAKPFVPVRVQLHAALLHDDSRVVLARIEGVTADVEAHDFLLSRRTLPLILVKESELQTHRQILRHAYAQIGLALRRQHEVKCAHLAAIFCAAAHHVGR